MDNSDPINFSEKVPLEAIVTIDLPANRWIINPKNIRSRITEYDNERFIPRRWLPYLGFVVTFVVAIAGIIISAVLCDELSTKQLAVCICFVFAFAICLYQSTLKMILEIQKQKANKMTIDNVMENIESDKQGDYKYKKQDANMEKI
ncbi:MAG: hypothetical protein E3J72_19350 [Planctomycetota bacterium]|nr:MAG: hypothetical protein E3J72_19350 [Planctomycetota bacterium]